MRILLVEDEFDLARSTARFLKANDYEVDVAGTLAIAWEYLKEIDYALVLLDRRLPDGDGLSLIAKSQRLTRVPRFLILSALGDVDDKVAGLDTGASDYIVKPHESKELLARIRATLRLPRAVNQGQTEIGALHYDRATRQFQVKGEDLELRRREFVILELLALRPRNIVRRNEIIGRIYGFDEAPSSNALESHISRLRHRLHEAGAGVQIQTARGLGYLLREE